MSLITPYYKSKYSFDNPELLRTTKSWAVRKALYELKEATSKEIAEKSGIKPKHVTAYLNRWRDRYLKREKRKVLVKMNRPTSRNNLIPQYRIKWSYLPYKLDMVRKMLKTVYGEDF